ncbi:uncharacterized protein LOC107037341 isoform X1 [Diachasma alloeum]|uniref:uncharacterized protein LOC107037341 isoform X1 n=1 Tax=Diachasma alloeum TaxID=454923 RepID=UPI0007382CDF|nr:uncharacterized protein LOC107037341 isoform X1 [Diachasma alloeum]
MGACLGRCFPSVTDPFTFRYSRHTGITQSPEEERAELQQYMNGEHVESSKKSKTLLSFLSLKRFKKKNRTPVSLELVEDTRWSRGSNKYFRLDSAIGVSTSSGLNTPLQSLDARTLLRHPGCVSSTPVSSLDLEWEHEVLPAPLIELEPPQSTIESPSRTSSGGSRPSSLTASPWSRVSTPNSLEWDSVEADNACDPDTEQLLTEIERLTDKTLKETGEWTGAR